jgi:TctA family transporter
MIGTIPGIGTTIASYLSYTHTKEASKHPELYRIRAIPRKVILDFTN